MTKIRVGLIGLGKTNDTVAPGAWGASIHRPSILHLDGYELVAVANRSIESAKAAIAFHGLPETTRAYGSPEDIADDPEVDLIVISVVVWEHYALAKPAILKKKHIFIEWPFCSTVAQAQELTELAQQNGVRTMVGAQGRMDPVTATIKKLVQDGAIGEVLSTTALVSLGSMPQGITAEGAEYYVDLKLGSNVFHNFFGHFLESFVYILGDFDELSSYMKTQFTSAEVYDMRGTRKGIIPKDTPDFFNVQGVLSHGALASINVRGAQAAVDGKGFRWIITGTKGEMQMTMPEVQWQFGSPSPDQVSVQIRTAGTSETVDVPLVGMSQQLAEAVPWPGTNTARLYEAFLDENTANYPTFESSLKVKKLLDRILEISGSRS